MPTTFKSPYATSFKSAIKNGTPAGVAVNNIAKRSKTSPAQVFNSLHKAGLCHRQKFNGQWIYWPKNWSKKSSAKNRNSCQNDMWQSFVDWFIASGYCTPSRLNQAGNSQSAFMSFCRKFFSKQFSGTPSTGRKSKPRKTKRGRKTRAAKRTASRRTRTSPKRRRKTSTTAKKRSTRATAKKRSSSPKSKKRSSSIKSKKRSTTSKARRRSVGRKPSNRKSTPRSYKFPISTRSYSRKAA